MKVHYYSSEIDKSEIMPVVVIDNGRPVGSCIVKTNLKVLIVHHLTVRDFARRKGVATLMMEYIFFEAVNMKKEAVTVIVNETNEPAYRLYSKLGFSIVHDRGDEYIMSISSDDCANKLMEVK